MGERDDDELVILRAIRQAVRAMDAEARGDDDAAAIHRRKSRVLLDMAVYDLWN